jgi:hypothetical protein
VLLLGADATRHTSHVHSYSHKRLLRAFASLDDVAKWMRVPAAVLIDTIERYDAGDAVLSCAQVRRLLVRSSGAV